MGRRPTTTQPPISREVGISNKAAKVKVPERSLEDANDEEPTTKALSDGGGQGDTSETTEFEMDQLPESELSNIPDEEFNKSGQQETVEPGAEPEGNASPLSPWRRLRHELESRDRVRSLDMIEQHAKQLAGQ